MEKPNFKLFQIEVCSPKLNPPIHPKKHELLRPQSWFDPTKPILSNVLILHSPETFIPTLFRKKRFENNFFVRRNASKFAIFIEKENPRSFFHLEQL